MYVVKLKVNFTDENFPPFLNLYSSWLMEYFVVRQNDNKGLACFDSESQDESWKNTKTFSKLFLNTTNVSVCIIPRITYFNSKVFVLFLTHYTAWIWNSSLQWKNLENHLILYNWPIQFKTFAWIIMQVHLILFGWFGINSRKHRIFLIFPF